MHVLGIIIILTFRPLTGEPVAVAVVTGFFPTGGFGGLLLGTGLGLGIFG